MDKNEQYERFIELEESCHNMFEGMKVNY